MSTETIYRVVYSPTDLAYAVSPDGVGLLWYGSYKQASRQHGELPLTIITADDLAAMNPLENREGDPWSPGGKFIDDGLEPMPNPTCKGMEDGPTD